MTCPTMTNRHWLTLTKPFSMLRENPLIAHIESVCPEGPYIYAGPFMPDIYFETRKLNPTRHHLLLPGFNTEAQLQEAVADLQSHRPQCAVMNYALAEKFNYGRDNLVERYLAEHYTLQEEVAGLEILRRR